ncbi:helix-turn-helix transcriptional regulator [Oribacterium sp. HCP28S3_H8]|uniref:helix-turn-helix transcriptional regulator n=1 Tax=Oribacterium sp. HCP28S3_H8 TaxID=3438945 RepID=UPI003F8A1694
MAKIPLRAARVAAGLTQEQLANKMGLSRTYINEVENGKAEVKTTFLYAFCHITGFTEDDILLPKMST